MGNIVKQHKILQVVSTQDGTHQSTTSSIPGDNTIPQNTEGAAYEELETDFTPKRADSKLLIRLSISCCSSANALPVIALFQDSIAPALKVAVCYGAGASVVTGPLSFEFKINSSNLNERTYKLRYGNSGAGTMGLNGHSSQLYGGVALSCLSITEYLE
jgi:hypothetical protein